MTKRRGFFRGFTAAERPGTLASLAVEMGFRPDVIERQLAHQERNEVRAAYNRAEYLGERRPMMKHWADYLDAMGGVNIIPLKAITNFKLDAS